ncbi:hypothetical protein LJB99_05375 [Deltaproteobacteria bacterium OttesenSCG-928-K17]|nr:hypothetical protein [Deltaproteobacteria bacterium OttesenSCG-928-K17]
MSKALKLILILFLIFAGPKAALADWPDSELTIITSMPENLPWGAPNPQAQALRNLLPRLSRELGVPVKLEFKPDGHGIAAANAVASGRLDGYLAGALEADPAMSLVIQGYTPYLRAELYPLATGWTQIMAIVVAADNPAGDLAALAALNKPLKLARADEPPISSATVLAIEAAASAGFTWQMVQVPDLDPAHVLSGKAEAMVLPLGWLAAHPRAGELKVAAVIAADAPPPCLEALPNTPAFIPPAGSQPLFAFYLPNRVNWRARNILSTALNNALKVPAMIEDLESVCQKTHLEGLEGAAYFLGDQYDALREALIRYGFEVADE